MTQNAKKILLREILIFLVVVFVGYLLYADGTKSFRYPLSARPEIKVRFAQIGQFLMFLGYPILALLRLVIWKVKQKRTGARTTGNSGNAR